MKPTVNTVLNAFHLACLQRMAEIASAIGEDQDADFYRRRFAKTNDAFQRLLFDAETGLYVDGLGTKHSAIHANLFPLAFGLVPEQRRERIVQWLASRGMRCSVYAAQHLLDGLFAHGADQAAVALMVAPGDRSWRHMVESGTTITWEAWDHRYKPNQDWNHAWGAAPANLLPRHVLGVTAHEPGWRSARISPRTGGLRHARGKVPTPRGPIHIEWKDGESFTLKATLPEGVSAAVDLPAGDRRGSLRVNGKPAPSHRDGDRLVIDEPLEGDLVVELKRTEPFLEVEERP